MSSGSGSTAGRPGSGSGFGWTVLALVFLDELLAMVAVGIWGWAAGSSTGTSVLWAAALPVLAMVVWWAFASPRAPLGHPVLRPIVKVLVFGLACLALWDAGHPGWALALLAFSVLVNGLATLPSVRALVPGPAGS